MTAKAPESALAEELAAQHIDYELIPHRRTMSAVAEAQAVGVEPDHVAKTIVLSTPDGFVRAVVPASRRIELRKSREALGTKNVHLASEQVLSREYPEFELGAVPPVGGARRDPVLLDQRLHESEWVVFEAGTHEHSVRLKTADLVSITNARVADICLD